MKEKKILINYSLYFLLGLLICFVGISNVFADTYTNIAELRDSTQVLVTLDGSPGQPVSVSLNSDVTMNYVTEISYILQNYNFQANQNYQLESHLARQQLTYANTYTVQGANGEQCLISYQYSIFQDAYPRWAFQCPHSTNTITINIRNSSGGYLWNNTPTSPNWNIFNWQTALLKTGDFSLGGSGSDSENIINNNNQNTQEIINNNNQNTQEIINSIDSTFNTCRDSVNLLNLINGSYSINGINATVNNGIITLNGTASVTSFLTINVNPNYNIPLNETITLSANNPVSNNNVRIRIDSGGYFDTILDNKNKINTINVNHSLLANSIVLRIQSGATLNNYIIKPQIELGSNASDYEEFGKQICTNKLDDQEKTSKGILGKLKDLFDTLFSDDDADVSGLNNMVGWLPPGPVDSIINLPLSLFNALLNTITGTCNSVTLTLPFVQQTLTLPCFDAFMSQYITGFSTLWTLIGTIASVFILYNYLLALYKWIDDTLTLRENNLPGYYDDNWGGGA